MAGVMRSGRAKIPKSTRKTVILGNFTASHVAVYRFTNGGKTGTPVKIFEKGGASELHILDWGDSIDLGVSKKNIEVEAGANDAEIVYEFLALA